MPAPEGLPSDVFCPPPPFRQRCEGSPITQNSPCCKRGVKQSVPTPLRPAPAAHSSCQHTNLRKAERPLSGTISPVLSAMYETARRLVPSIESEQGPCAQAWTRTSQGLISAVLHTRTRSEHASGVYCKTEEGRTVKRRRLMQ